MNNSFFLLLKPFNKYFIFFIFACMNYYGYRSLRESEEAEKLSID